MTGRLNRLVAAIAACAALAACGGGTAWADTADGKTPFSVKAADGTTLDGATVGLYRIGEWDTANVEHDKDGALTAVHAIGTDTDDRTGFQVAADGTQTTIRPHGRAMNAAETAGISVADGTDPLDAVWRLDPTDSRVDAFARAYAGKLEESKTAPDATLNGAGSTRLDPGVYIAMRDGDADTARLAATMMADGGVIAGRDMGSVTLAGKAVRSDDTKTGLAGLADRAKRGVLSLFGMNNGIAVQDIGGSAGVNGYGGGGGGSGMEWRWWFQDTKNRDGDAKALAYRWGAWDRTDNPQRIHDDFDSTCDKAKRNAMARYGHEYGYYRIVAVGSFIGNNLGGHGGKTTYHGDPGDGALRRAFWTAWNAGGRNEMQAESSDRNGYLNYVTSLADEADGGHARIACVVLGRDRPTYSFGVRMETQAQSTDGPNAAAGKYNYVDGGRVDGTAHTNYGGIEHDTVWVRDRISVTATDADANFKDVVIETHLKVDENGDHKPDHEQVITEPWNVTVPKGKTIDFWTKPFWASQLSNWGKGYWPKGHLWFDTWVKCAPGKSCGLKQEYHHYGDGNPKEEWYRTPTRLELSTSRNGENGVLPKAGGTQRVRDSVSVTPRDDWWLPGEKATLKSWLHYDADGDGKSDADSAMKTSPIEITGQGWAIDSTHVLHTDWYKPSDLKMDSWQPGTYWFDAAVDAFTEDKAPILAKTYWDHVGRDDESERFSVSPNALDITLSTKAAAGDAANRGSKPVHDSVTLSNSGKVDAHVAKVRVTLNYPGGSGVVSASKTTGAVTVPAGGKITVDSPGFTPSDLRFTNGWHANIRADDAYWFDVSVDPADVADAAGNRVVLSASPSHDGRTDEAERFKIKVKPELSYSTKAADTFDRAGGDAKVHDDIMLDFDEVATLSVTSTLNWAAAPDAAKADKALAKTATLPAKATSAGPGFTPSDFGWKTWKAGKYWYDLDIPSQVGNPDAGRELGLATNQAAERWTAVGTFGLDLAKLAYNGTPGSGKWTDTTVKDATFTLTETTDGTGATMKPGAKTVTVTTGADGTAHLLDGEIGATGDRWFKLVETKTPASYEPLGKDTYWMIHVAGTRDGGTVDVTGSDDIAKALLRGVDDSTVTVGNPVRGSVTPPMTGGSYDVMRVTLLAGGVMLVLLMAGIILVRRRNSDPIDHAHAR